MFTSPALLIELGRVLARPTPQKQLAAIGRAAHDVFADFIDTVELVAPDSVPPVIAADADDDHVLAAAVAAEADLIVSGDRHLLDLGVYQSIRIVTVSAALALVSAAGG